MTMSAIINASEPEVTPQANSAPEYSAISFSDNKFEVIGGSYWNEFSGRYSFIEDTLILLITHRCSMRYLEKQRDRAAGMAIEDVLASNLLLEGSIVPPAPR